MKVVVLVVLVAMVVVLLVLMLMVAEISMEIWDEVKLGSVEQATDRPAGKAVKSGVFCLLLFN